MKVNFSPSFDEENFFWQQGVEHIIGVDEVGRGAFAGPVVAAGVVFDKTCLEYLKNKEHQLSSFLTRINDSKKLKPQVREELSEKIQKHCLFSTIAQVSVEIINKIGIGKATTMAIQKVVSSIRYKVLSNLQKNIQNTQYMIPDTEMFLLLDGFALPSLEDFGLEKQKGIIKGDQKSISIAAASIIAKVYRDDLMRKLAKTYPDYGFDIHKGYGTKRHQKALFTHGLSEIHRTSFDLNRFLQKN